MLAARSVLRYVQDGYIASPPGPRKDPHKNLRLTEALKLARDWGCDIREAHGDALVYHQLVENGARRVPVSLGRRDTSQVLVSFLRKVVEATREYWKEHPVVRPMKGGLETAAPATNGHAFEIIRAPKPPVEEVPAPASPVPQAEARDLADFKNLIAAAQLIHYRKHTNADEVVPFADCTRPSCVVCREEADRAAFWKRESDDSLKIMGDLNLEIVDLKDKLKAAQDSLQNAPAPVAAKVSGAPAADLSALNDDQRRWTYFKHRDDLFRICTPWIGVGVSVKTRIFDALDIIAQKENYPAGLLMCFQRMDFGVYRPRILNVRRPDGARNLVGVRGWDDFEATLEEARKKVSSAG